MIPRSLLRGESIMQTYKKIAYCSHGHANHQFNSVENKLLIIS